MCIYHILIHIGIVYDKGNLLEIIANIYDRLSIRKVLIKTDGKY